MGLGDGLDDDALLEGPSGGDELGAVVEDEVEVLGLAERVEGGLSSCARKCAFT